jgi:uncharacterized protein YggT (Ycf19 family)
VAKADGKLSSLRVVSEIMTDGPGYWFYIIPNFALAAAMYTLIGRYVLALLFKPDSEKVIWRVFAQLTDPILKFVRALTPQIVPNGLVMVFAIIWLLIARMALLMIAFMMGFLPSLGA